MKKPKPKPRPKYRITPGQKYGRLTTIEVWENAGRWDETWLCRCDCGNPAIVRKDRLTRGNTRSCGCLGIETATAMLDAAQYRIRETRKRQAEVKALVADFPDEYQFY